MLQRIYGTSFPKKGQLDEYLAQLEEAKRRDHNKLGRELELFTTVDVVGQGLPLLMPKGAKVFQILQRFVEDEEERRGYQITKTPFMAKKDLYEISGHWDHYRDGMFIIGDEDKGDELLALRPMTCPFQFMIYKSKLRSYRDLPLRYSETSTLFRNEASGEMHGLIRLRQFTISEGHIICMPEQLEDEFRKVIDLIDYILDVLGLREDIWFRFSKWDPNDKGKYIDQPEAWEHAQRSMKAILDRLGLDYEEAEGEAAFYGPKLDIQSRNVHGKEDTIITVQIDFALPERFDLSYVDQDGTKKRPLVIHRTSVGCYERTLAMLIEKYAGALPTWLAPVQVRLLPISDAHLEYTAGLLEKLRAGGFRAEVDKRNEKIGYKIREGRLERIPYLLIVGDKEVDEGAVSVRSRKEGDLGPMAFADFMQKLGDEVASRVR
jgi:threonyl-tRNA synthetase